MLGAADHERETVIDRAREHAHPLYAEMTYPFDYGHFPGPRAADGQPVDASSGRRTPDPWG